MGKMAQTAVASYWAGSFTVPQETGEAGSPITGTEFRDSSFPSKTQVETMEACCERLRPPNRSGPVGASFLRIQAQDLMAIFSKAFVPVKQIASLNDFILVNQGVWIDDKPTSFRDRILDWNLDGFRLLFGRAAEAPL